MKRDITFLALGGGSLLLSFFAPAALPVNPAWLAILLCGAPIVREAAVGLFTRALARVRTPLNKLVSNMLSAGVVALVSLACVQALGLAGVACSLDKVIIGGIIPLVPGVALTNGIRDVANCDYLSGTIRAIDAVLIAAGIALGVGLVLKGAALLPGADDMIWELLVQLAAAFGATVGFAVLVNAPPREFVWAGVTGAVGWGCYWLYLQWQPSVAVASLLASLMLALLSRVFSVVRRCPATVFLISGIFALVPGAGIYYTAYYFIMGDNAMAVAKGVETFKIAVALAVGIVLVLALPGAAVRRRFAPRAGKKKGRAMRWKKLQAVLLCALVLAVLATADLGYNFFASLVPEINDGISVRGVLAPLLFSDHCILGDFLVPGAFFERLCRRGVCRGRACGRERGMCCQPYHVREK